MAKLKNIFIGCPVTVKGEEFGAGIVASIDEPNHTAWICFPHGTDSDNDGWQDVRDLKLAQFTEPHKVVSHLEKNL